MSQTLRETLPQRVPRHDLLLPAGRHHQPDPELRRARADRRADHRHATRDANRAYAPRAAARDRARSPASPMRASSSRARYPQLDVDVDRTPDRPARPDRARRHQQPGDHAGRHARRPRRPSASIPKNGVSYPVVAQTPEYQIDSLSDLQNLPVTGARPAARRRCWAASARSAAASAPRSSRHYNIQPAIDIYATPQGRDLGAVAGDIQKRDRRR